MKEKQQQKKGPNDWVHSCFCMLRCGRSGKSGSVLINRTSGMEEKESASVSPCGPVSQICFVAVLYDCSWNLEDASSLLASSCFSLLCLNLCCSARLNPAFAPAFHFLWGWTLALQHRKSMKRFLMSGEWKSLSYLCASAAGSQYLPPSSGHSGITPSCVCWDPAAALHMHVSKISS